MNTHFDMDKLYRGLEDASPTTAIMDGCFKSDHRKQRSFVYTLKYHTLIGDERQPMEWQMADVSQKPLGNTYQSRRVARPLLYPYQVLL